MNPPQYALRAPPELTPGGGGAGPLPRPCRSQHPPPPGGTRQLSPPSPGLAPSQRPGEGGPTWAAAGRGPHGGLRRGLPPALPRRQHAQHRRPRELSRERARRERAAPGAILERVCGAWRWERPSAAEGRARPL